MYRVIIVPYPTGVGLTEAEMNHVGVYNPRQRPNGRYHYAFQTLREAREVGASNARNYANGCAIFILDDEAGMIVDEARHPVRPALTWKNIQVESRTESKAATTKTTKSAKKK